MFPEELEPVVAKINHVSDLGLSSWWEVVYYDTDAKKWCPYAPSNTFSDGETVVVWVPCEILDRLCMSINLEEFIQNIFNEIQKPHASTFEQEAEELRKRSQIEQEQARQAFEQRRKEIKNRWWMRNRTIH